VKPENILIKAGGMLRLGDFGLSSINLQGVKKIKKGTLLYMSPETIDPKNP
jgi:serine/threonine protein kinase